MAELLPDTRRAQRVWAVVADGVRVADDGRVAHRAALGHVPFALCAGPPVGDDANDLGDDVARLVQDHVVADADVLAPHLVEVVERRPRHG
jgi:hypothetical protein